MSSDVDTIRARKPRAFQLATAITTSMSDVLLAKHNLSIFAAAFAVNAFACLPLIFVNRPLLDDMGRSMVGYLDWAADGRPLASVFFYLINLGKPAVNLAPFAQILALAILAMACVSLAAAFRVRNPIQAAIGTLPLGANPYFLNNLSYQFDAPLMAAAVLCAVVAANILTKAGYVRFSSSVLLIAALMLYQPAVCTFLVITLFSIAIRSLHQENSFRFVFKKLGDLLAVSIVSVGFYILAVSFKLNDYAIEHGSVWKLDEAVPGVWKNLSNYWWRLYEDWHTDFAVLAAGLVIATALGSLLVSGPSRGVSKRALAVICAAGIIFLSLGPLLLLQDLNDKPRIFLGLGAVLAVCSLQVLQVTSIGGGAPRGVFNAILRLPVYGLAYSLIVIGYATAAAAAAQKEFEDGFLSRVAYDIESVSNATTHTIGFIGSPPISPILANTGRKYPAVLRIIPNPIADNWYWGHRKMQLYGVALGYGEVPDKLADSIRAGKLPATLSRRQYDIYILDEQAIVRFKSVPD
jgi:Glucosyl transferase GtrII